MNIYIYIYDMIWYDIYIYEIWIWNMEDMTISKFPSSDIDLVGLLFRNPMMFVTIQFGELCLNISVGGCWELIAGPNDFRNLPLWSHWYSKISTHSQLTLFNFTLIGSLYTSQKIDVLNSIFFPSISTWMFTNLIYNENKNSKINE